jgi:LruC domain-containing protein
MKKYLPLLALLAGSCVQMPDSVKVGDPEVNIAYNDFDFATVSSSKISLRFQDQEGSPFAGIRIQLLRPSDQEVLLTGLTDAQGSFSSALALPSYLNQVIIEASYIGIPNRILVPVKNGEVRLDYLGAVNPDQVISYDVDPAFLVDNPGARMTNTFAIDYAAKYNSAGVPENLEPKLDNISARLLEYINASLPEGMPVPTYHPTYLADGKKTTLDIIEQADVWLTFVHEGAGWRNSIGYYVYPTNQPPKSMDDIEKVTVLFPNASMIGSGGGMKSGHKVKIGRFDAGVSVGLVLFANGWSGFQVEKYNYAVFAEKNLNPEPDRNLRQHNVLLWDEENKLFLLGFEDVRRDNIPFRSDQDFNDAILFVTSNPVKAISTDNVSPIDKPGTLDKDGDGINDNLDEYPNDISKAYDTYYPSASGFGSFAFEDNWPEMGDYDFNDLVVDYQFKHIMNSKNEVVEIHPKFKFKAAGAGLRNGFGFELESESSSVKSVSGAKASPNSIKIQANGTEANQKKAVIVVTENVHQLFGVSHFINTENDGNSMEPVELELKISLSTPVPQSRLGLAPYNPFLIVGQDRSREVHLPGYAPTSLADQDMFGKADDAGKLGQTSSYYKSKTALPWAINTPESFAYPVEKQDIRGAHLVFDKWAKSSGFSYMDWYRGQSGYRERSRLIEK